jgi:hypothetical protein
MRRMMSSVKERMIRIIEAQPDDSNYDEILKELSFIRMVNQGIEDSEKNDTTSHDKIKDEIDSW